MSSQDPAVLVPDAPGITKRLLIDGQLVESPRTFASINPAFVVLLTPLVVGFFHFLRLRGMEPSTAAKIGLGLLLTAFGPLVMLGATAATDDGATKASAAWLFGTYAMTTFGELCLSPVGLSYMSKLAPPRFVGQVMGMWFLSMALGSNLAGQLSGQYDASDLASLPALFLKIFWYTVIAGALMLLLTPVARKLMAGVH